MSTTWTLARERICDKALEKCNRLGIGRTVSNDDRNLCLEALDSVLKNLLWHGYEWPKTISTSLPLAFTAGLQTKTLPSNFYTGAYVTYVIVGSSPPQEVEIELVSTEQWRSIIAKTTQAYYPDRAYIDNFHVLSIYPVPNQALQVNIYYNAVINDSAAYSPTDLDSPWMLGLIYGVAAEIGDEFGVDPKKVARFEAKWAYQMDLGLRNETSPGPDRVTVDD